MGQHLKERPMHSRHQPSNNWYAEFEQIWLSRATLSQPWNCWKIEWRQVVYLVKYSPPLCFYNKFMVVVTSVCPTFCYLSKLKCLFQNLFWKLITVVYFHPKSLNLQKITLNFLFHTAIYDVEIKTDLKSYNLWCVYLQLLAPLMLQYYHTIFNELWYKLVSGGGFK